MISEVSCWWFFCTGTVWEKLVETESNEWLFWQEAHLASSLARTLATQCYFIGIYQPVGTADSSADTGINRNETPRPVT